MIESPGQRLDELLHRGNQTAWTTAALVLSLGDEAPTRWADAAQEVLTALGLDLPAGLAGRDSAAVAAQAAAPLLQAAAAVRREAMLWAQQPDEALLAQGLASARNGSRPVEFAAAAMPGRCSRHWTGPAPACSTSVPVSAAWRSPQPKRWRR